MKELPVGIQTYEEVVKRNNLYIDKTDLIFKLSHKYKYVFLSRPRRFGKSLLISTMKSYFQGRKDLFESTAIYDLEKDWTEYPVVHLDLSIRNDNVDELKKSIKSRLSLNEKLFGISSKDDDPLDVRLSQLVIKAYEKTGRQVVLLIDEYDAPMLNTVDNNEAFVKIRSLLNNLFSPIKALDPYFRFVFITGISKFSQVSIFSVLNNLMDISLDPVYEAICGFSKDELRTHFVEHVQALADDIGWDLERTYDELKDYYDGYHFSRRMTCDVFNPFSLLKCLAQKSLSPYWFESASPSALLKLIGNQFDYHKYERTKVELSRFSVPIERIDDLVPLLYQSGYISIKGYDDDTEKFDLAYPNKEVRVALADQILRYVSPDADSKSELSNAYDDFKKDDDIDLFIEHLKVFFDAFPYSLNNMNEKHYHSILYTALVSFGADVLANPETALGKADLLLRMPKTIYVIELKYERTAAVAMRQIRLRKYEKAYINDGRRVVKLAINFSEAERNITDVRKEVVEV